MVIDEMITLFLDSRKHGEGAKKRCGPRTLEYYERNLRILRDWFLSEPRDGGITKFESIKRMQMRDFFAWLDSRVEKGEWSTATAIQVLSTLRTFLRWARNSEDCELEDVTKHAAQYLKWLPPIPEKPSRRDIPEVEALKKFRTGLNTDDKWEYRDYVLVTLIADTGMRAGEAANLRVDGCRLGEKILFVTGKTGPRTVPITGDTARTLKGWLIRRESCPKAKDSPYVFVSKRAPQLNVDAIGHSFRRYCKRMGLSRVTAHTFRHAYATHYLRQGGSMENLRINMGHTNYETLRKYLDVAKQGSKEAQKELERVSLSKLL